MKRFLAFMFLCMFVLPFPVHAQMEGTGQEPVPDDATPPQPYTIGKVIDVFSEGESDEYGIPVFLQELHVKIQTGEEKGKEISVPFELQERQMDQRLEKGDRVILTASPYEDPPTYYISDVYRLQSLALGLILFIAIAVLFARMYAVRAILGLALSFVVIGWVIMPRILAGDSPVLVSLIGAGLIASISLYLAHGVRSRTTIAFIGTITTAAIAIFLASLFVNLMSLFGIGSEEAFYLQFIGDTTINLQGLLLGGIIIGMLGVLDDVTTAQAAAVEEIHDANDLLGIAELYKRGMSVGREHITSLINTLVLAYTGAALPLLLLFKVYETPFWVTLNSEIVMEEIVRMLAGSMALVLAVPITTWLAARYYGKRVTSKQ